MQTRALEAKDLPALKAIYDRLSYRFDGGFPDFLGPEYERAEVVVDADDCPIAVVGAKRAIELVMVCDPRRPVLIRLEAIARLHAVLRRVLGALGYREASSFVPPELVATHGRTMQKRFGWQKAWPGYRVT